MRILKTNYIITKILPKHTTMYAKKWFKNKPIRCIEVGVLNGENAKSWFKNLNIDKLYLIDPYKEFTIANLNRIESQSTLDNCKKKMYKNLKPYWDRVEFLNMTSEEAIKYNHIDEKVDYIYLDGNHNYLNLKWELDNFYPLLKEGGILTGDDYNQQDVSEALQEFCKVNKLKYELMRCEYLIKR